jgi:hypothetical protein
MSLWRATHSQYGHRRVVATFGDHISYYKVRGLTNIFRRVLYLATIERVRYEVHRNIASKVLPYEELSEERPWTNDDKW